MNNTSRASYLFISFGIQTLNSQAVFLSSNVSLISALFSLKARTVDRVDVFTRLITLAATNPSR